MRQIIIQVSVPDYLVDEDGFLTEAAEIDIEDALDTVDNDIVVEDISKGD